MSIIHDMHPALIALIDLGKGRGWLAYEELNRTLPDELVDPDKIDGVLYEIDEQGIELIDEREFRARRWRESKARAKGLKPALATAKLPAVRPQVNSWEDFAVLAEAEAELVEAQEEQEKAAAADGEAAEPAKQAGGSNDETIAVVLASIAAHQRGGSRN